MVRIQKICPKILRDHLAVQASSVDSPEKQILTSEKFLQANVHGTGASPTDVDAIAKTKGVENGGDGKDKSSKPGKFDGTCFWCGSYSHVMEDCRKKAAGNPKATQSPGASDPKPKGKGKGGKGKKRVKMISHLVRNPTRRLQVCSSVLSADTKGTIDETGQLGKGSRNRRSISGRPSGMEALVPMLSTLRLVRESI